jgi:UDP-N-acetylglucosamine acyltransferase
MIDPTSYVSPGFTLGEGVTISRNCVLEGSGRIGAGTKIGHNVILDGEISIGAGCQIGHGVIMRNRVTLGDRNQLFPHCVLGELAQHPDLPVISGGVELGDDNTLREFVSIHVPTVAPATRLGSHCYVMVNCNINHDCQLGDHVKLASGATLAGYVTVGDYAYFGLNAVVHQRLEIGEQTMLGMNSTILRNVPPFAVIAGTRFLKFNAYGLARRGFSAEDIAEVAQFYGFPDPLGPQPKGAITSRIQEFYQRHEGEKIYKPELAIA